MKRLTQSNAFCLLILLALVLFASAFLTPSHVMAKTNYTNGSGMAEGDPIDGLGSPSAGGGGTSVIGNSDGIRDYQDRSIIFVLGFVPCNYNSFFIPTPVMTIVNFLVIPETVNNHFLGNQRKANR